MKNIIIIIIIIAISIFIFSFSACNKSEISNKNMTIIKDCTGSYLQYNNNYHVCNFEIIDDFENETEVIASFNKIEICTNIDGIAICKRMHPNEGLINITEIKEK